MNVKEVVTHAKQHVRDLFAEESLTNIGLEEVELDEQSNEWIVTIGFSRPWDAPSNSLAALANPSIYPRRAYKIVRVANSNGAILSVKNREAQS